MFMITNLIEPRMGKLILNHLIGNNRPEFRNGFMDSYFFKRTLKSNCLKKQLFLGSRIQNHPNITKIQVALKYHSFKHNSAHLPSLNFTPKLYFEPSFLL